MTKASLDYLLLIGRFKGTSRVKHCRIIYLECRLAVFAIETHLEELKPDIVIRWF